MNIVVFDTETTSLEKPFCYNIGYVIVNTDNWETLCAKSFVVEQIWHNLPLFNTAYYANKRPIYVDAMRAHRVTMDKFGYICAEMRRDFKKFAVERAFAYNSPFDEKVFDFNCDWFKVINPFEELPIVDIRGFVHRFLVTNDFRIWCEEHEAFTESGNYSTTAETLTRYISGNNEFEEDHTALSDSKIECDILRECVERGADLEKEYAVARSIKREVNKTLHIRTAEQTDYYFDYTAIRVNKDKTEITLK